MHHRIDLLPCCSIVDTTVGGADAARRRLHVLHVLPAACCLYVTRAGEAVHAARARVGWRGRLRHAPRRSRGRGDEKLTLDTVGGF
jgi:hypothetical protein